MKTRKVCLSAVWMVEHTAWRTNRDAGARRPVASGAQPCESADPIECVSTTGLRAEVIISWVPSKVDGNRMFST